MKTKMLVLSATACGAFLLGGGVAVAGPVPPGPIGTHPMILSDGTIANSTDIGANGIEFSSRKNERVVVQQIDLDGGATSGWHTHPALTIVTVIGGAVRVSIGCHATVEYTPGQSFVEPPGIPNLVVNKSATLPARIMVTLVLPPGMALRTNVFAPDCTHPEED